MSRLKENKDGWQWDEGPVFNERWLAVEWGKANIRLERLKELDELLRQREACALRIKQLEELR